MGEQVFLSALDDLNQAGTQLEALATMDMERMRAQLRQLERNDKRDEVADRELTSLRLRTMSTSSKCAMCASTGQQRRCTDAAVSRNRDPFQDQDSRA